jgi:hypothetical protein|tara:strand:- start:288 stop:518 length:231 start_codon:yes stop_codon:yes gene_type:complete
MKLDIKAFALAGGIIWALGMFVLTLIATYTGYGDAFLGLFANAYPWYTISVAGAFIGGIWGFIRRRNWVLGFCVAV